MAQLPEWQPLDGVTPPGPSPDGSGRVLALVASETATADGWAPTIALALAHRWSAQGQRVMLVDAGLTRPSLHEAAGILNREGLSDAVHYGASIERVARPVEGAAYFVVTAGTPVADPTSVVRADRWERISGGMSEAGVTLLLYLPHGEEATSAFLGSASTIVVISDPDDAAPEAIRDLEPLVHAVVGNSTSQPSIDPGFDAVASAGTLDGAPPEPEWVDPQHPPELGAGGDDDVASAADVELHASDDGVPSSEVATDAEGETPDAETEEPAGVLDGVAAGVRPAPTSGGGGITMILFVVLAVIAAAALGWFMVSGLG
ncbi:MAG: hypothetical protein AAF389_09850 [Gemmatimonadota bacterium]